MGRKGASCQMFTVGTQWCKSAEHNKKKVQEFIIRLICLALIILYVA